MIKTEWTTDELQQYISESEKYLELEKKVQPEFQFPELTKEVTESVRLAKAELEARKNFKPIS